MRFTILDAWRGLAALLVALYRLDAAGVLFALPFVRNAYLFVDFFFVLSGFVIAHAYFDRIRDRGGLATFMIRRFGRLWPLHVVMTVPFVAFEGLRLARELWTGAVSGPPPFTGARAPGTILADLTFVQSLGFFDYTGWNTVSWSISTEYWTYVVFALACLVARRAIVLVAVGFVAIGLAIVALFSPTGMDTAFHFGFERCLAGFFTGVLINQLWRERRGRPAPFIDRFGLAEGLVVVVALAFVSVAGQGPISLAAPLVFGAVVYVFAHERGALSRLFGTAPFQLLGELSYSIYMVALLIALAFDKTTLWAAGLLGFDIGHVVTMEGSDHTIYDFGVPGLTDLFALLYLATVIGVSWLTFRLIETPGRRFFNALAGRLAEEKTSVEEKRVG